MSEEKKKTVVVAEDEPVTRMDICGMLSDLGFDVCGEASDGFDAVEMCRNKKPDIALLDVRMPVFDGLGAAEVICREDLAGCCILLTAFSDKEIIDKAVSAGVTGYLVKPVDINKLLPTIEVAYAQSQRLRQSRRLEEEANEKLAEDRLIHKAQKIFAEKNNCSDAQAYEVMRKTAMDKRVTLYSIARAILEQQE